MSNQLLNQLINRLSIAYQSLIMLLNRLSIAHHTHQSSFACVFRSSWACEWLPCVVLSKLGVSGGQLGDELKLHQLGDAGEVLGTSWNNGPIDPRKPTQPINGSRKTIPIQGDSPTRILVWFLDLWTCHPVWGTAHLFIG